RPFLVGAVRALHRRDGNRRRDFHRIAQGLRQAALSLKGLTAVEDEQFRNGHRQRLRDRFAKDGGAAMPDYELLELTLFAAVPRKDVKPLAKTLIARFGSFAEVIAAPRERLSEIAGVGDAVVSHLKIVEAAAVRLAKT